ncbi:pyrroline-5-carboxylate reductase [Staphylospora marina]|uniref:pyrroline-5-carboxylate reductase n=1 Tax=Staphylospora marina TaxID=2490858 RepID=UPI000F5BFE18|nr:pyrroline-5-carboxylate reductase [Staphylospora marina]
MLKDKRIGFVGAGSMSEAIVAGLLTSGEVRPENISLFNRQNGERIRTLIGKWNLEPANMSPERVLGSDVVILAVKPKDLPEVLRRWGSGIRRGQLVLSVAAGVSTSWIEARVGEGTAVIRCMPNTSCAVGRSATALAPGSHAGRDEMNVARRLFESIGEVTEVDERLMDAVTGLSGSGPAYVYYLAEALESAGISAGLSRDAARRLTVQTLLGAAHMLRETEEPAEMLRRKVTSPGGTTMAGLEVLDRYRFPEAVREAVLRAAERSVEMGRQLTGFEG